MRAALIAAVAILLANLASAEPSVERWAWTHVRWSNASGQALLIDAAHRSALLRTLLEDLERSDVIVYVRGDMALSCGTPTGGAEAPAAHLAFASATGKVRYLHVTIDTWRAGFWDAIPLLGHELQHALEVAAAPDVRDERSFERLYFRIGWQSGVHAYETDRARNTGRRILEELVMAAAPVR
jgi:hypothetical protein